MREVKEGAKEARAQIARGGGSLFGTKAGGSTVQNHRSAAYMAPVPHIVSIWLCLSLCSCPCPCSPSSAASYRTGYGTNKGTTGPSTGLEIRTGSGSSAPTNASVLVFYASWFRNSVPRPPENADLGIRLTPQICS
jgi:hypothetical protein